MCVAETVLTMQVPSEFMFLLLSPPFFDKHVPNVSNKELNNN